MTGLTVHVDNDGVVASDDDGRTTALSPRLGAELRDAFERAAALPSHRAMTAGTRAALAEARAARPRAGHEPPPAWQDDREGPRLALTALTRRESRPLADVLTDRHSQREWGPPSLEDVATVLLRCGRVMDWVAGPDGYVASHRPVPSAGARHPLDVHLLAGRVEGLPAGAWRFDALRCELVRTSLAHEPALAHLGLVLAAEPPPAALVAVAHLHRTLSRYPTGLSLLWRDAGALLGTLHLCSTDLGLASCIAGTCGVLLDEPVIGVIDVGVLLVGAQRTR